MEARSGPAEAASGVLVHGLDRTVRREDVARVIDRCRVTTQDGPSGLLAARIVVSGHVLGKRRRSGLMVAAYNAEESAAIRADAARRHVMLADAVRAFERRALLGQQNQLSS